MREEADLLQKDTADCLPGLTDVKSYIRKQRYKVNRPAVRSAGRLFAYLFTGELFGIGQPCLILIGI